jgi:hypothetical protein
LMDTIAILSAKFQFIRESAAYRRDCGRNGC